MSALAMPIDLDAYRERLGLEGHPNLFEVHRAHVWAIPFENLDPHQGKAVALDPETLERKLVAGRRGGYCFEHNLLLASALEADGHRVAPMLARVRWGVPRGTLLPLAHLVLRVEDRFGRAWHADVGFGAGTLLEPIPFGAGGPYEQAGWRFRVVEEGEELVLQTEADDEWRDVYAFAPRPVPRVDIEMSNWFTATHPRSRFVTGLLVAAQRRDGTRLSLSDWNGLVLASRSPAGGESRPVVREEIPSLLEEEFGLPGFELDADGRVRASSTRAG